MSEASQKSVFLSHEGDAWFQRNKSALEGVRKDPVRDALVHHGIVPRTLLEIGCSDGWRLRAFKEQAGCACAGVDPSMQAVQAALASDPAMEIHSGTAESLPFETARFDVVIYGFCLYLCDRSDLFRIAAEGDRVLQDGGVMVIYDFFPDQPYKNTYAHYQGVYAYKMDHAALFTWNPAYAVIGRFEMDHSGGKAQHVDDRVAVTLLRKQLSGAYIDNPHRKA